MNPINDSRNTASGEFGAAYFRKIRSQYVLTNDLGHYCLLRPKELQRYLSGQVEEGGLLHKRLKKSGFFNSAADDSAGQWQKKHAYLWQRGPGLHIVVVTLRCNHKCLYCQASPANMRDRSTDMTLETAAKVVERIFATPNPTISIEFQGGEPLANWPAVRFIIERALELNHQFKKHLQIGLVSNLSLMDQEKLEFLLEKGVSFCTSLDGPEDLHNRNRVYTGGSSYSEAARWWRVIMQKTMRRKYRIDGLTTVTRFSLSRARDIVNTYKALGARGVYLRPLSPLGLARNTWGTIGYSPDEFAEFYRSALDYILELNLDKSGGIFVEQTAKMFLTKILLCEDPNQLDVRSPCGAGIGQMAYNFDGAVFTCDEGRMLSRMGDESFRIGSVAAGSYAEAVEHPAVKAMAVASCLDNQPQCSLCAYKPYCGVCPIYNYVVQADIFGNMPSNARCRTYMGILDYLFEKLQQKRCRQVFQRWVTQDKRGRPYKQG